MPDEFQRRLASVERGIAEIKPGDIRVSILGTVIDKSKEGKMIVLDDGTGKINVNSESPMDAKLNQVVRVFGRAIPMESGFELQGEVVQDMSGLDMGLLKRVKGLKI